MLIIAVKWGLDAVRLGRQFIEHIIVIEIWQYVECLSERIMTRDMSEILCKFLAKYAMNPLSFTVKLIVIW